jgi:hypothetical protein
METLILIGILGIAVIAFLLWEIKKAIDQPESVKRFKDWQRRHPNASLVGWLDAGERNWPTAEEENWEAEKEKRRIKKEEERLAQDPVYQVNTAVLRGDSIEEIMALKKTFILKAKLRGDSIEEIMELKKRLGVD